MKRTSTRKHDCLFLFGLLAGALSGIAPAARAQTTPAHDAFALQAVRGPQDATAKLYLAVLPLAPQTPAPQTLKDVLVRAGGGQAGDYRDVPSPGGQAIIDIGDFPLLATIDVQATVQTDQSVNTEVLYGTTAVTEFALNPRQAVVADFEGYGAQMNSNLYTSLSNAANGWINNPPQDVQDAERKVKDMKPGLCRIFLSPHNYEAGNEDQMASFYKTAELAQTAGARVNVTWWFLRKAPASGNQSDYIQEDMQNFANTLIDLVKNHGITAIREITIQNEPNSVSWLNNDKSYYKAAYQLVDSSLRAAGIRDQIKFVGGDLVLNGQAAWFTYMADNMNDILDGWSEHIYWNYWDPGYFMSRLNGILAAVATLSHTKPLSLTEYGVRGIKTLNGSPIKDANPYRDGALTNTDAGYYQAGDGTLTPISQTNIAAFQQAWFNMQAANDGFIGFSKWDFYRAQYDFGCQDYSLIGYLFNPEPGQDRWPPRPSYYMEWMMANTTGQHWQVLGYHGSSGAKLITPFRGPGGELTIFAISTDKAAATFSIGGLPAGREFHVLTWNAGGSGRVTVSAGVNSGRAGAVSVDAPAFSVVALTTVPAGRCRECPGAGRQAAGMSCRRQRQFSARRGNSTGNSQLRSKTL